ncbi:methyltransferase domain-containing protein [Streptomyces apricus]|uniref:Protein-L-isoaspartate(D-aspartate) O-methyltransferase n=1 Tax=Streptomyces apricus TaxID=1828112 RepID=A0A5A9ZW05_9ACTN|nr:protein-L-isoaspartate(D-aspartate) O-methyltransferase [Streptomyces apricus]KAA0921231.1 protein-L-isoaspartate(D-aspartate) O-methyltransferase [Streptomyces apricus]
MTWVAHARTLAREIIRPESRWHSALAEVPRHQFVVNWWERQGESWALRSGPADPPAWMATTYSDQTLVTRIGTSHADRARPGDALSDGTPTSSSTLPSLLVRMYRHAMISDNDQILVTTGSGYGTALACVRLGDNYVTSIDVDEHLVHTAQDRLSLLGMRPQLEVCDITGPLPRKYDRIVSTLSIRSVPASWLQALRPCGRLVTTIAGTGLILTADKTSDGGATGRIEWDRAGFMPARHGADYEPLPTDAWKQATETEGGESYTSRYPLLYPPDAWDVMSMLELKIPGIQYHRSEEKGLRTVVLRHPDGSWARADTADFLTSPTVHEGGPQRLWTELEKIRNRLNREGTLPLYGARVTITPEGETTLTRGAWTATL